MGRRRTCREERRVGLEGLELLIKVEENRNIHRHSLTNLRSIAGFIVAELLGTGIVSAKYFYQPERRAAIYRKCSCVNVQADINAGGLPNSPGS